ncbi:MAG: bifunctional DNA primase/polymerase [Candidatus Nitrosocosmicus sp.]
MNNTEMKLNDIVYWSDFWFYTIGVNVIPCDSKKKIPLIPWTAYQEKCISKDEYESFKRNGTFGNGVSIIVGKIWRGKYNGKYLACIDIDNKKGIEEFLSNFGKVDTIEKLAEKTIVEWHNDNPNKVHIYFIVEKPLTKKSGITVHNNRNSLTNKEKEEDIPSIEVKSKGSHGIMIASPSIHKNGFPYEFIGIKAPTVLNETQSEALENTLNLIYKKYNMNIHQSSTEEPSNTIKELFEDEFTVSEGNNRHVALLRVMESLISRNSSIISENEIKEITYRWNQKHCKPPLDEREFEKQWQDAKNFISQNGSRNSNNKQGEESIPENEEIEYLIDIKHRYISVFQDQLNRLYITIKINDHVECIPLNSKRFKSLVRKEIIEKNYKTISDDKIDRIVKSIEAELMFDESIEHKELSLRVASMENKTFCYDLTNQKWEIVKINSKGWQVVKDNSIPLFKRYENNVKPQAYPKKNDENDHNRKYFKQFLNLFNLQTEKDRLLLENYIISLFIPEIQKAILVISGNGGGAKTTTFSLVKNIIDPSTTDTLSFSSNKNDLIQALEHNYVNYFDNVSYISHEVSDILCRAVTGSGDSKRELYTTDGVFIYKFKRCIGINGINLATTRPDFIDRSLILKVKRIPDKKRRKEKDVEKEFLRLKPFVLGYIFDVLVKYLNYKNEHEGEVILNNPPRMADFAESCEIISRCSGYPENAFINAYRENIDDQNDEIIETSPIAECLIAFMENKEIKQWIGTPTQLYHYLGDIVSQVDSNIKRSMYWPKGPNRLTYKINEFVPNLLKRGIEIVTGEKINGQRVIVISRIDSNQSISQKEDELNPNPTLSDNFIEPLPSYINLYIHRKGSSDIFECEKCPLRGDIQFMKKHHC